MRTFERGLLSLLTLGVAGYVVVTYAFMPLGSALHPDMEANFLANASAIYTHVFASIAALTLGPFQFSNKLRQKRPALHRWMGRGYLVVGVLVGGLSGLYMSRHAFGGPVAQLGFATLAVLWLYTGGRAYLSIRSGELADHRKWMLRNFSLTMAAVTLRIYLPLSMAAGIEFTLAYPVIAWLCWVPNLALAEWRFNLAGRRVANDLGKY